MMGLSLPTMQASTACGNSFLYRVVNYDILHSSLFERPFAAKKLGKYRFIDN